MGKIKLDFDKIVGDRLSARPPEPAALDAVPTNIITLHVRDQCRTYERNPRTTRNAKYDEIKESIRARGLDQMISVTLRPGREYYVPAKGGNTRLEILQELVAEGETRFQYMDFIRVEYRGEAALLAAHIVENDQRADLVFWNAASSTFELKEEVEKEKGTVFSLRDFSAYLKEQEGIQASPALLSHYGFAMKHLAGLAHAATALSRRDVQDRFVPLRSRFASVVSKLGTEEILDHAWALAIDAMRDSYTAHQELDFTGFGRRLTESIAKALDFTADEIGRVEQLLQLDPQMDAAEVRSQAKGAPALPAPVDQNLLAQARQTSTASPPAAPGREEREETLPPTNARGTPASRSPEATDDRAASAAGAEVRAKAERVLWHALDDLASLCGIDGCLVATDKLPLGFMVDIPVDVGGEHGSLHEQALQGGELAERYYAWWWLALLSGQNTPQGLHVLDDCAFKQATETHESWTAACEELLGDPVYAEDSYHVVRRLLDASDVTGPAYLAVINAVRTFNEVNPERSSAAFWISVGVPSELVEGGS